MQPQSGEADVQCGWRPVLVVVVRQLCCCLCCRTLVASNEIAAGQLTSPRVAVCHCVCRW